MTSLIITIDVVMVIANKQHRNGNSCTKIKEGNNNALGKETVVIDGYNRLILMNDVLVTFTESFC